MRIIKEGKENVRKLLGEQQVSREETRYRLMRYVLRTECPDEPDGTLLLNVITGRLLLLDAAEAQVLQSLPATVRQIKSSQTLANLMQDHFLVPADYDEKATADKLRTLMGILFAPKGINSYTILTTTNCNARCFYCYQAGRAHIGMSEQTANELVDYMLAQRDAEKPLSLHWFGGEPLVGMARIEQICARLRGQGVEFKSRMTSNGYLLTEDVVQRAVDDWHLQQVQITLDGTEEVYNRTKAYAAPAEGQSPYRRVLQNIRSLADHGVMVSIRLNLGRHNHGELALLVEELGGLFAHDEHVSVYAHVLYEGEGFEPVYMTPSQSDELHRHLLELRVRIQDLRLHRPPLELPSLKVHECMADSPGTAVVYPDGRLFKCQHTAPGDEYGTLGEGVTCRQNVDKFKERVEIGECIACPQYPSCFMLMECPGFHYVGCNPLLRQRSLEKQLEAMRNVYACVSEE